MSLPVKTFGERLKEGLESKRMKPIELSEKLNINKGIISKYLNDKYKPKQDRISEIAEILEVNEAWLMGYDVNKKKLTIDELILIEKIETAKSIINNKKISDSDKIFQLKLLFEDK